MHRGPKTFLDGSVLLLLLLPFSADVLVLVAAYVSLCIGELVGCSVCVCSAFSIVSLFILPQHVADKHEGLL